MTDTLRALALSATPGPWTSEEAVGEYPDALVYGPDGDAFAMLTWNPGNDHDPVATAAYIAACSPDRILALLDMKATWRRRALRLSHALRIVRDESYQKQLRIEALLYRLAALERVAEAARGYLAWRARRLAQWQAVADCGHEDHNCPEMQAVRAEPVNTDAECDAAIDAALAALEEADR